MIVRGSGLSISEVAAEFADECRRGVELCSVVLGEVGEQRGSCFTGPCGKPRSFLGEFEHDSAAVARGAGSHDETAADKAGDESARVTRLGDQMRGEMFQGDRSEIIQGHERFGLHAGQPERPEQRGQRGIQLGDEALDLEREREHRSRIRLM